MMIHVSLINIKLTLKSRNFYLLFLAYACMHIRIEKKMKLG